MPNSRVILYIPDLADALRRLSKPRLPRLEKLLSRAVAKPVTGETTLLAECFGLRTEQIVVAPLKRLAETGVADSGNWWCADPVHLAADRDQLVMLPLASLAVSGDEMRQLADIFNKHYVAEGFRLEIHRPGRGYLHVPADWHCRSWNPAMVEGQAVTEFMPTGPASDKLKRLMTEIQMLWHEHPVNQKREAEGKPALNSLWLWGGGYLPEKVMRAPARIVTSQLLVRGLAKLAGQSSETWPADLIVQNIEGDCLVALSVRDFDGDPVRIERQLINPLWQALIRGRVNEILLYLGGKQIFALTRQAARRFWRRSRPLFEYLSKSNDQPTD